MRTTMREVVDRHEVVFLDAYGVLNDAENALPGAAAFIEALNAEGKPYFVLTNDASRLPETLHARFARLGLPIPLARIVSSGDLLRPYFAEHALHGQRCVVLGPADSRALVERAGGRVVDAGGPEPLQVLVVCDDSGYPFLEAIEAALEMTVRAIESGRAPALILPNPDLVYPKRGGALGFTAGTVARMIEDALAIRFSTDVHRFVRLGKPHAPIFEEGCRRAGTRNAVMVGDQLRTDILGANRAGLASALVAWGVTRIDAAWTGDVQPTYVLEGLELAPRG